MLTQPSPFFARGSREAGTLISGQATSKQAWARDSAAGRKDRFDGHRIVVVDDKALATESLGKHSSLLGRKQASIAPETAAGICCNRAWEHVAEERGHVQDARADPGEGQAPTMKTAREKKGFEVSWAHVQRTKLATLRPVLLQVSSSVRAFASDRAELLSRKLIFTSVRKVWQINGPRNRLLDVGKRSRCLV